MYFIYVCVCMCAAYLIRRKTSLLVNRQTQSPFKIKGGKKTQNEFNIKK